MSQVKGGRKTSGSGRGGKKPSKSPARDAVVKQTADASSIIMGVFFLIAIIVGTAAWMGQSMSLVSGTMNNLTDGLVKTVGLSVDTIRIYEAAPEQENRIRTAMGIREGDSMFRADPKTIKARLENVKGLGDVQVHRFWPGQISIFVTPLEAKVVFWDGERHIPMDPGGGEVPDVDVADASFPVVAGEGAVEASPDLLADLNAFPAIFSRMAYADRKGDRRWDVVMVSGVRVQLPSGEQRIEALERLSALQRETGILDRHVANIDLRDPAYVYVRRSQLTAAIPDQNRRG